MHDDSLAKVNHLNPTSTRINAQVAKILVHAFGALPVSEEERASYLKYGYGNLTREPRTEFTYTLRDAVQYKQLNRQRKKNAQVQQYVNRLRSRGGRSKRAQKCLLKSLERCY